jgi:hypothetical protein
MKKPLIKIYLLESPVLIDSEAMPVPRLRQKPETMDNRIRKYEVLAAKAAAKR